MRVAVTETGDCPSCRMPFQSKIAANTTAVPGNVVPDVAPQLSNAEKVFIALAIVCAGFQMAAIALFHFVVIPGSESPGVLYFIVSFFWVLFLSLTATSAINIHGNRLGVIPTMIQCVALCFTAFFPIAIMGFLLLRKRMKADAPVN
jgi:hypothetical protein